ncbi:helix-turn-helix domain-containing protein [Candidatus Mycolicibacterium alkanivorans]|uniref:Helix-turn-helix domain-containing protein n=1 Tax=Candidatus Mycolicibacterium alkanivorans TaxID=2954114 RepID=A0ABS9YW62_9MYCO|nr:helix-turn-helix domain-containing protein [Candidatus Mycolicibacterium alkanivorans]MCI4675003.1 helix-turn-helix domain-containing protein [Candidatus Mycolicibacterium alkanivorans]
MSRVCSTEVIGTALVRKAAGLGYRRIATALGRSPSTVRRWLRRTHG